MSSEDQARREYESSVEIYRRGAYELPHDYDFANPDHVAIWVALQQYVDHLERIELRRHNERVADAIAREETGYDYIGENAHLYAAEYPHAGMYEDPYRLEEDLWSLYEIAQQQPRAAFSRRHKIVRNITECLFKSAVSRSPIPAELPTDFFRLNRLDEDAPAHTLAHLAPLADMVQVVLGDLLSVPATAGAWNMSRQGARQRIFSRGLPTVEVGAKTYLARETVEREYEIVSAPAVSESKLAAIYRSLSGAIRALTGPRMTSTSSGAYPETCLLRLQGMGIGPRLPLWVDSYWWASAISLAGTKGGWEMREFRPGVTEEMKSRSFMLVCKYMDDGCSVQSGDALAFANALDLGVEHLEMHDPADQRSFWLYLNQSGSRLGAEEKRYVVDKYKTLADYAREGAFIVRETNYRLHGEFYGPSQFEPQDYDPLTHEPGAAELEEAGGRQDL